jgi:predicted transcriptional regulator
VTQVQASAIWIPSDDEWLDQQDAGELVEALRELITELVGWGVDV